jgi:hypothetical protein
VPRMSEALTYVKLEKKSKNRNFLLNKAYLVLYFPEGVSPLCTD